MSQYLLGISLGPLLLLVLVENHLGHGNMAVYFLKAVVLHQVMADIAFLLRFFISLTPLLVAHLVDVDEGDGVLPTCTVSDFRIYIIFGAEIVDQSIRVQLLLVGAVQTCIVYC